MDYTIKKGSSMHTRKIGACGDEERWILPDNIEGIDDDTYYEIEYEYHSASDPSDFSCVYIVNSIKPIPSFLVKNKEIIKKFKAIENF